MNHDLPPEGEHSHNWDDEIWDENQWEAFMKASDRRAARYANLVYTFLAKYPRPLDSDPEAVRAWKNQLRFYLESKGWDEEDTLLPLLWIGEENPDEEVEQDIWFDIDAEEELDDAPFEDDFYQLEQIPVYRDGMELALDVLHWANNLDVEHKDLLLVEFCAQVNQIPAKVAGGHGMGYEKEALGGNIACVKRALKAANLALDLLPQLKKEPFMNEDTYHIFYERLHDVRNDVGIYVQELRRRFELGID